MPLGQHQGLAEALGRLVDGEPGAQRGDLEQHAARLAEVDRAEVLAVDDLRGLHALVDHALTPGLVVAVLRCPGDVVNGPRSLGALLRRRRVVVIESLA